MHVLSIAFTLFVLMDPIGNIPLYISFLKNVPPRKAKENHPPRTSHRPSHRDLFLLHRRWTHEVPSC